MEKKVGRNQTIDAMRGIAMLLVVLGHTMTGCTENSEASFLFNVIWSLQMPLFILISGYVTRYSKRIRTSEELLKYLQKRTIAYVLPWLVWTFLIRGIIFHQSSFLNIKYILWHMDSGYWFLITIHTISVIFGVAQLFANRLDASGQVKTVVLTGVFYVIGMVGLAGIGIAMGLSFMCIKLTLYYMPFYFAGYLFGSLQEQLSAWKYGSRCMDGVAVLCLGVWLSDLTRIELFNLPDSGVAILLRAVISLCGCIAICKLCGNFFTENRNFAKLSSGGGSGLETTAWKCI